MEKENMIPKVLLLYSPSQLMNIEVARPDGSLGLLYLAGALEDAGYEADILDCAVGGIEDSLEDTFHNRVMQENGLIRIGMNPDRIKEFVSKGKYNIVGINSNFTPQTRINLQVAQLVKEIDKNIHVIVGGVNARNLPERFLNSGYVDQVVMSEGERAIVHIVKMLEKGVKLPPKIFTQTETDLDKLPIPRWEKLPLEKYETIASPHGLVTGENLRYAAIMTSRGCPFSCSYCHISLEKDSIGAYRIKSVDRVIQEIEILKSLNIKKLYFEDDSLLAKKARVKEIFSRVLNMGFEIADVNGINLVHFQKKEKSGKLEIDREYIELLKNSGFNQLTCPVESASQRILDKYATAKLNHKTLNVVELIKMITDIGIVCTVNMMIGFPDETENEIMNSIDLGKKLVDAGARYCMFFIPIPFPGCALFDYAIKNNHLDKDFDTDIFNWKRPVMKNTLVSPERIEELRDVGWHTVNTPTQLAKWEEQSVLTRIDKM